MVMVRTPKITQCLVFHVLVVHSERDTFRLTEDSKKGNNNTGRCNISKVHNALAEPVRRARKMCTHACAKLVSPALLVE